jgi:hypothetical protein
MKHYPSQRKDKQILNVYLARFFWVNFCHYAKKESLEQHDQGNFHVSRCYLCVGWMHTIMYTIWGKFWTTYNMKCSNT